MVLDENFAHVGGKQVRVTKDVYALCVTPITTNCTLYGGIGYKEY